MFIFKAVAEKAENWHLNPQPMPGQLGEEVQAREHPGYTITSACAHPSPKLCHKTHGLRHKLMATSAPATVAVGTWAESLSQISEVYGQQQDPTQAPLCPPTRRGKWRQLVPAQRGCAFLVGTGINSGRPCALATTSPVSN